MTTARKLAMCYGTRPQVIKASLLMEALAVGQQVLAIDTGQHYDWELNALLYQQLGIPPADSFLEVGSGEREQQLAAIEERAMRALLAYRPEAVVVIGDTNSTLGCARAAVQLGFPVVHVEAGLRARDATMPEELNRREVDAIAALLCVPCRSAADRLEGEGARGAIAVTGDIARDVLLRNLPRAPAPREDQPFVFATLHRAALTADTAALAAVVRALEDTGLPVIFPAHPRTRGVLESGGVLNRANPRLGIVPPLGYLETIAAIRDAALVITDSGGVQREAYWLGTPCITVRDETEWQETIEAGANRLVPPGQAARLPQVAREAMKPGRDAVAWNRDALGGGDAARRIADAISLLVRTGGLPGR